MPSDVLIVESRSPVDLASLAHQADLRGDYSAAALLWQQAAEVAPENASYASRVILALKRSGQIDVARDFATKAAVHHPSNLGIAMEGGWIAAHEKRWADAATDWNALIGRFPDEPRLRAAIGKALAMSGDHDGAELVLAESLSRAPGQYDLLVEHANCAAVAANWVQAATRWGRVVAEFKSQPHDLAQFGRCLAKAGRWMEASRVLQDAVAAHPAHLGVAVEYAAIAETEPEEAVVRWQAICARFPEAAIGRSGLLAALRRSADFERAEAMLLEIAMEFPADIKVALEGAWLATERQAWDAAIERWKHVLTLNQRDAGAKQRLAEAQFARSLEQMMEAAPQIRARVPVGDGAVQANDDAEVMSHFESMGENCEFGLVQRYHGSEPLGLLRFAGIPPDQLLEALQSRFDGVGEAENTVLIEREEYIAADKRFGLYSHTCVSPKAVPRARFFKQQCGRMVFLRDKLIEDLEEAKKIFVIVDFRTPSEATARKLHEAIRAYGDGRTLYVRAGIAGKEPGSLEEAGEGLMLGYTDRYGNRGKGLGWDIPQEAWLKLCRTALASGGRAA